MDIIAAHRHGLIEQLEEQVTALAGRPRDHEQRAVVLHHLYDHSRGSFAWALAEARRELRIAVGLERLAGRLKRWGWLMLRREQAGQALEQLARAFGNSSVHRCIAISKAYRLSAIAAVRSEAERSLSNELLDAFEQCHAARRGGTMAAASTSLELARLSEELAASASDPEDLALAWQAVAHTGLRRLARQLLGSKALERAAARDVKRGTDRIERELRADPRLPASFRANPAQHYYGLQQMLAERRRQQWREACDREPDAFELAA